MSKLSKPINIYSEYFNNYVLKVKESSLNDAFLNSKNQFVKDFNSYNDDFLNYAYQKEKWTVKELILHIIDTERILQYRALRFARNDKTDLKGFNENDFVTNSNANLRSKESLLEEFKSLRNSTIVLYSSFSDDDLAKEGTANNHKISVKTLGFVIVGHQNHHFDILKERYIL